MALTDYNITIAERNTGLVYDTINLNELLAEKIEEYKRYLPNDTVDNSALKDEVLELVGGYLDDLISIEKMNTTLEEK